MASPTTTTIDDRDLDVVNYTGAWTAGGMNREYKSTVSFSTTEGDSFTVKFYGSSISVFGTLDSTSQGVVTAYRIDNGPPERVTSPRATGDTYGQQFWKSPTLSPGEHTLNVRMVKVNRDPVPGEGTIWFDYFTVETTGGTTPPPLSQSSLSITSATPTISDSATSVAASESASSSSTPVAAAGKKNIGPIVGAVIGVLLLLLALTALFLFYRNRRKQRSSTVPPSEKPFLNNNFPPSTSHPYTPMAGTPASSTPFLPAINPVAPWQPPAGQGAGASGQPAAGAARLPPGAAYPNPMNSSANAPPHAHHVSNPSVTTTSISAGTASGAPSRLYIRNADTVLTYTPPKTEELPIFASTGSSGLGDSVAELKKRQQEAVANYNAGLSGAGSSVAPIQHVDSGIRTVGHSAPEELPPVYSAN